MPPDSVHGLPRLRVLTWQVHGNYLYYLTQLPCEWWIVTKPGNPPGYGALGPGLPWGPNVRELPFEQVPALDFDCVLYQARRHWDQDRFQLLTPAQRELPCVYLEHDPPQEHPTNTRHWASGADLLVHVTPFNALMWDSGELRTRVIEHTAIVDPKLRWRGDKPAGIAVINHLLRRGRRLGADVYLAAQQRAPLHLVGMGSEAAPGGLGEIVNHALPGFIADYRYLFNPIRWTSLGLSVVEALAIGMPVVGLATTELASVIDNGRNGWTDTDPEALIEVMQRLSSDQAAARRWGAAARETFEARFSPQRFVQGWTEALAGVTAGS